MRSVLQSKQIRYSDEIFTRLKLLEAGFTATLKSYSAHTVIKTVFLYSMTVT